MKKMENRFQFFHLFSNMLVMGKSPFVQKNSRVTPSSNYSALFLYLKKFKIEIIKYVTRYIQNPTM